MFMTVTGFEFISGGMVIALFVKRIRCPIFLNWQYRSHCRYISIELPLIFTSIPTGSTKKSIILESDSLNSFSILTSMVVKALKISFWHCFSFDAENRQALSAFIINPVVSIRNIPQWNDECQTQVLNRKYKPKRLKPFRLR